MSRIHGVYSTYVNHRCRCTKCSAAASAYMKAARKKRLKKEVPTRLHGSLNAYNNYGCRCVDCRAANADRSRRIKRGLHR